MPRKTHLEAHLSLQELQSKRKRTRDSVARQQLKVIEMIMKGMTQREVAERSQYSTAWVHTIVKRYNELGPQALRDHRRDNPGRPYRLSAEVRQEMSELVSQPPAEGGLWTGPLLVAWARERTGDESIDDKRGWEWLKQLNCRYRLKRRGKQSSKRAQGAHNTQRTQDTQGAQDTQRTQDTTPRAQGRAKGSKKSSASDQLSA